MIDGRLLRALSPPLLFAGIAFLAFEATAQSTAPLIQPSNLSYLGSFSVPAGSGNGFNYGGAAPAYNPANDSLYLSGHTSDNDTAEIKIPAIGGTPTVLQPLNDAFKGKLGSIGAEPRIGGHLVYKNKLYMSGFVFYDASASQTNTHFSRSLNLSDSAVVGPYKVGSSLGAGFYSGYMGLIPASWQARLGGPALVGNCCLSIISRTSYGPAASVFDPESGAASAQPLLYYPSANQTLGTYGASGSHPVFNGTTRITGIVFPEGTASVLFFGMTGTGNYCYGEASTCNDPAYPYKADHAYPYKAYVWAYDANDLLAVKAKSKQPWQVVPYQTWVLTQLGDVSPDFGVGGAAYDAATNRIFVSKKGGNGFGPTVYVFRVNNAAEVVAPNPPSAVIVQ